MFEKFSLQNYIKIPIQKQVWIKKWNKLSAMSTSLVATQKRCRVVCKTRATHIIC